MKQDKMIGHELRNLSIMVQRYIGKKSGCCSKHHMPTHLQILVMDYVYDNRGKDIFQKDLEKKFSIRRSTVTNMLKRMERDGLIKRVAVSEDARLKKIIITDKAKEHSKAMRAMGTEFEKKLTEGLSDDEIDTFLKIIDKIKSNLE